MLNHIITISDFIVNAFLHIWPYLLITIPLAVAVQMSGAAKYINRALGASPIIAIFLAGIVGAFSPFCSCGVIPVVAALLLGGVPLAPVMTFWIASPSMDPEIFFLSVAAIGWNLAVWRLIAALFLSLMAGFITHFIMQRGWLGQKILRTPKDSSVQSPWNFMTNRIFRRIKLSEFKKSLLNSLARTMTDIKIFFSVQEQCCASGNLSDNSQLTLILPAPASSCDSGCHKDVEINKGYENDYETLSKNFFKRLLNETVKATAMVCKFMALAFFLEALITLYIPSGWIAALLGRDNPYAILTAALLGIPVYTSNLAALPMISGLLTQGMSPAAALAFLIAGPTTTLPAMAAVWGLTTKRIFALYVSFSLFGAILSGFIYKIITVLS